MFHLNKHLIWGGNPPLNIWKQDRKLYMETETGLQTPDKHLNIWFKYIFKHICELKFAMIIPKELSTKSDRFKRSTLFLLLLIAPLLLICIEIKKGLPPNEWR